MKKQKLKPLDPSGIKRASLAASRRKVNAQSFAKPVRAGMSVKGFLKGLPDVLAAGDLLLVAESVARARRRNKPVIFAMGAHPIKTGLSPVLIDLMREGVISGLAMNGAAAVHDYEIALCGKTSEDVAEAIGDGSFGMARETGSGLNLAALACLEGDKGLGEAVGEAILDGDFPFKKKSLLAEACRLGIPATVHAAIGTDIVHMHPEADGAAIGKGTLRDFRLFAACVAKLKGGVYFNAGSAVVMPEVFLKALSLARNLGHPAKGFLAVNMDFIHHYRPTVNVVQRPVAGSGKGVTLIGHHEIMIPLLAAAIKEELRKG